MLYLEKTILRMTSSASWAVTLLKRVISDLEVFQDGRAIPEGTLDAFIVSLELAYRELVVLDTTTRMSLSQRESCDIVRASLASFRMMQESNNHYQFLEQYCFLPVSSGLVGRPSFDIPSDTLVFLIENRFTVPQIADIIGVSVRTVRRRMTSAGLSIRQQYSSISSQELDDLVRVIQHQFPMCGNRQMQAHLLSRGFRIQQHRVRESQRRVDPEGTLLRRLNGIFRREYCVPAPRSLYHIDGNHKLIRYLVLYINLHTYCTVRVLNFKDFCRFFVRS